jgi:hypothetical protein
VIVDINGKVLLTGSATGGTTYSGTYNSSAYIQIDNSSGVTKDYFSYSDDQSTPVDINITNKQLVISTDKMFTIMLEVSAQAGAGCGGCSAIASAIIDPTIKLGADFIVIEGAGRLTRLWAKRSTSPSGRTFRAARPISP